MFFKSLFLVGFNQCFRFNKRILIVLCVVFLFKILLTIILKLISPTIANKININESKIFKLYAQTLDDSNVNTESYLNDYVSQRKKLLNVTLERDLKFSHLKKSIPGGRNLLGILKKSDYLIVEYSKFFYQTKYCHLFDKDANKAKENTYLKECFYKNCVFSCDKSKVATADALLFYDYDLLRESTENSIYIKSFLQTRKWRHDQIWILWNDEPNHVSSLLDRYQMNWTMSYRRKLFIRKIDVKQRCNLP